MICCLSYINDSYILCLILANLCPTPSIQPPRSDVQKSDRSVQISADGRGRNPRAGEAGRCPRQAERLREMHRGTRVSLHGLLSRPELNGQPATLILWDVSAHVENCGKAICQAGAPRLLSAPDRAPGRPEPRRQPRPITASLGQSAAYVESSRPDASASLPSSAPRQCQITPRAASSLVHISRVLHVVVHQGGCCPHTGGRRPLVCADRGQRRAHACEGMPPRARTPA